MTTIDKKNIPEKPSATLRDDDIKTERILGRRSLFGLVGGGVSAAGLAACSSSSFTLPAPSVSDLFDSGPNSD